MDLDKLTPYLERLAQALGTTIDHILNTLRAQVVVEIAIKERIMFFSEASLFILALIAAIAIYRLVWGEGEDGAIASIVISIIVGIVAIVVISAVWPTLQTLYYNPEMWVLQQILQR